MRLGKWLGLEISESAVIWVTVGIISVDKHAETRDGAGKGFVWRGHGSPWGADKKFELSS